MKILVDTQVFLWAINGDPRIDGPLARHYSDPRSDLWFSMASAWEIFVKISTGKLSFPEEPETFLRQQITLNRLNLLPIRLEHTAQQMRLPWHHKDPFDRLLIAQAQVEGLSVLTADSQWQAYDVRVLGAVSSEP